MTSYTCDPFSITYPASTSCTIMACPGQLITASSCGACTGDTFFNLYGSRGNLILSDDDGCNSQCSAITYQVPLTADCQQYSLQENCYEGSCSATTTVVVSTMVPTVVPTTAPSRPTTNPSPYPSYPPNNPRTEWPSEVPTVKPTAPSAAPTNGIYAYVQYFYAGETTCDGALFQANVLESGSCYGAPSISQEGNAIKVTCDTNDVTSAWTASIYKNPGWSCTTWQQDTITGTGSCGDCHYLSDLGRAVQINCGQTACDAPPPPPVVITTSSSSSSSDMSNAEVGGIVGGVVGIVLIGVFVGLWVFGFILCASKSSNKGNDNANANGNTSVTANPINANNKV